MRFFASPSYRAQGRLRAGEQGALVRGGAAARARSAEAASAIPAGERFHSQLLGSIAIVCLLVLALFGPNMSMGLRSGGAGSGDGSPIRQALYLLTFAIAVASVRPWQRPASLLVLPLSLTAVLAWCWISLSWAIEPSAAIRRLILTSILIWTIYLAVRSAGYARSVTLFRAVMLAVVVASLATVVLLPQIGIHQQPDVADPGLVGAWRGLLLQKNFAGAAAAVTILIFVFDSRHIPTLLRLGAVVLSVIFLYGTMSKTSMGICALALLLGWLFSHYNPAYRILLIPVLMAIAPVIVLALDQRWSAINTQILQNPQAFTGRAELWAPLLRYASEHLLTGAGYGSFWNIGNAREPIHHYSMGWVTGQSSGHNGFLDILVQIGLPGLILALIAFFIVPVGRLATSKTIDRARSAMLAALIFFCLGHNFTESSLLERDIAVNVFLILAVALVPLASRTAAATTSAGGHRTDG